MEFVMFEDVDGMEVLRQARARSPGTEVIVMTAYATAAGAVAAMKEGAIDYLIKPFAIDEFRAMKMAPSLEHAVTLRGTLAP